MINYTLLAQNSLLFLATYLPRKKKFKLYNDHFANAS